MGLQDQWRKQTVGECSAQHPHEPAVAPVYDADGRCLVCCITALEHELDPPVCRLQFPDGTVPGNSREAAEGWKKWADDWREAVQKTIAERDEERAIVARVWKALEIDNYTDAQGRSIDELVADLKRRAELWERLHDERSRETEIPNRRSFDDELVCLLNKYSKENGSNTPDFILAEYLIRCLESSDMLIRGREEWYGRTFSAGSLGGKS